MRLVFLIIISTILSLNSLANTKPLVFDTASVVTRNIDVKTYIQQPEFQYDDIAMPRENLWDKFWKWFWKIVDDIFYTKAGSVILNWVIGATAVAIITFFVLQLTGMNQNGLFAKDGSASLNYAIEVDDIHGIDFNAAIDAAAVKQNYRLAVRLLYLQTLKLLADNALIDWRINKTNAAYVQELKDHQVQLQFLQLTNYFDKAWYGESKVIVEQFDKLKQSFSQFQQQIKQ